MIAPTTLPAQRRTTLPALRRTRLAQTPSAPLLTWYDLATGERVELSHATVDGWVAKTAGLLRDVVGLAHGDVVAVDLPRHWLAPVQLAACAELGLVVAPGGDPAAAALAVCGPDGIDAALTAPEVMAVSLLPMAMPFRESLPAGVEDYCLEVRSAPDRFSPSWPVAASDGLLRRSDEGVVRTQTDLLADAEALAGAYGLAPGTRVLVDDAVPDEDALLLALVVPLVLDGSAVVVTGRDRAADADAVDRIALSENAVRLG